MKKAGDVTMTLDANTVIKGWPEDAHIVTAALLPSTDQANHLAVNLAHDIITGKTTVARARRTYVDTMLAFRGHEPTPYMSELQFKPQPNAGDPDTPLVSTDQLTKAAEEHKTTIPVG